MKIADFKGKNIAILGFGLEGKSTLNFLMNQNVDFAHLTILDASKNVEHPQGVRLVAGDDYLENLDQYDVICKSAGIPMNEKLFKYKDKIITQVQLFFDNYIGKVIAITASKGKSTISSLLYKILKDAGYKVKLVGNIGNPVLDEIDFHEEYDYVVIELSSYMLDTLHKKNYISVLGSIFPEHLDRHGGFENYTQAKLNILDGAEHTIVYWKTMEEYALQQKYSNIISYGNGGVYIGERHILGEHNLDNISAVLAVVDLIGVPLADAYQSIKEFKGLPHRMENIGLYGGIQWIDDAISTTPESTIQAIKTFGNTIGTLFLGGTDRGYDFKELINCIFEYKITTLILFPDSGHKIKTLIQESGFDITHMNLLSTDSMEEAVQFAYRNTEKGKIALLSTASPSYSIRKNFEEKGDLFKKHVNAGGLDFGS